MTYRCRSGSLTGAGQDHLQVQVRITYWCRSGSLTGAGRELAKYKLDLVGVEQVRWDQEGGVCEVDYNFFL